MKYGIKHTNGQVDAISRFDISEEENLPSGFLKITEIQYLEFKEILRANVKVMFDEKIGNLTYDVEDQNVYEEAQKKGVLRNRLKEISRERDLRVRLGEDTTDVQRDFDALKLEYQTP